MQLRLKPIVKALPPVRRIIDQRDAVQSRLKATAKELAREARRSERLQSQVDALTDTCDAQAAQLAELAAGVSYASDGMRLRGKSVAWLADERFMRAYQKGVRSGHAFGGTNADEDIHIEWRVHIALWAAQHAMHLEGDFVECGVNTGIYSLAICEYLDFNSFDRSFYLFDTYEGVPESQMLPSERKSRVASNVQYEDCYDVAKNNFAPYDGAILVRGMVPDTLTEVDIDKVAYLSIDMNIVYPEIAAIEFFWDKLVSGAIVLLDDYGWSGHAEQQRAWDEFARGRDVAIGTLPTGQGLLIKP